ncbi:phosphoadenosine phosphosulfate reductase domain-containing protein [Niabella hibiscisoli]|uniref:phosphoadenosine phosphosulfate reductase domain-containing protein n=1 Tax=Niabella hibiscisoli TaxID=1825928 RepID=UPI001F0F9DD3|nr:phosphoadenosine phosphosulfate reductase family protein [Niabella hibiscisoli]MCH5715416.1 hypothetical protein [Niabella hibiscisoli]
MFTEQQIHDIENASIAEAIEIVAKQFPDGGTVFSTSLGQEDQVLTHVIARNNLPVKIFTLDTGRLFTNTTNYSKKQMHVTKPISRYTFLKRGC